MSTANLRKTKVLKPRKPYRCDLCGGKIDGEHYYVVYVVDGMFGCDRVHIECEADMERLCAQCDLADDCQVSASECLSEHRSDGKSQSC